jgi:hypothetical protein
MARCWAVPRFLLDRRLRIPFMMKAILVGGYRVIGPGGPERQYYLRHHVFRPYDERPIYGYGYGPAWSYDYYGPPIYYGPSEY